MGIQASVVVGRTKNRNRYEKVAKNVRGPYVKGLKKVAILRGQGKVPSFKIDTVSDSMHILLKAAWRLEVETWAVSVIKRVAKDTRMTAGSLLAIGEELGPHHLAFIKSKITGGTNKIGHFKKPGKGSLAVTTSQTGGFFGDTITKVTVNKKRKPGYNYTGIRSPETGARQSRGSVKVLTGSAKRPVFSFTWDYGAWQHLLMDQGAEGTAWAGSPLRTTATATADFIESLGAIWKDVGLDFAKFWTVAGDEAGENAALKAAESLASRKSAGRTLGNIGDQIIGRG